MQRNVHAAKQRNVLDADCREVWGEGLTQKNQERQTKNGDIMLGFGFVKWAF